MNKTFSLLTFIFAGLFANAQITIDQNDVGIIGDSIVYVSDTNITGIAIATPTGGFQTFDYTNLGVTDIGDVQFKSPTGTPAVGNFPGSNLVLQPSDGGMIYLAKTSSSIKIDGIFGDILNQGFNSVINVQPNLTMINFPTDYQDTYSVSGIIDTIIEDTFTGFFDSLRLVRTLQIISNVDAYGELKLPSLTDTVLRKYDMEMTIDSIFGQVLGTWQPVQNTVETKHFYRFLATGKGYYLLEAEADGSGVVKNAQYQTGGAMVAGILNYKNISCNGLTDGIAKVTVVGGIPPFTYVWNDPASSTTQQITGLSAGFYTVTVTDFNNATSTDMVEIIDPDTISISGVVTDDNGTANGEIEITPNGGTPGFSYSWSNGSTNKDLNSLPNGVYTVTVTDSRGCTNSETFMVVDLTSIQDIFNSDVINVFPNPSTGMVNIKTNKSWSLKLYTLVGTQVLVESGIGNTVLDVTNQPSGIYIIEMTIDNEHYIGKLQLVK